MLTNCSENVQNAYNDQDDQEMLRQYSQISEKMTKKYSGRALEILR